MRRQELKVAVVGRSRSELERLVSQLRSVPDVVCSTNVITDGNTEFLADLRPPPDIIVLRFDAENLAELATLADTRPERRRPLIVVGPAGHAEAIRLAMRSGARDFLPEPVRAEDLIATLDAQRTALSRLGSGSQSTELIAVVGAAGGVGTSLVACNLALAFETEARAPTLLVDLDINAAPLASFLDLTPDRGLPAALAEAGSLDEHALPGYLSKHRSGMRLLGAPARSLVSVKDLDLTLLPCLLDVLSAQHRYIVADASHTLDDLSVAVLGRASKVVLVMQQSVVQLKKAARMLGVLRDEIGQTQDSVVVVVNRRIKHSTVSLDDISRTLARKTIPVIPNDYKAALASIDSGTPLLQFARSSPAARAIVDLQGSIIGTPGAGRPSLLRRALPFLSGD